MFHRHQRTACLLAPVKTTGQLRLPAPSQQRCLLVLAPSPGQQDQAEFLDNPFILTMAVCSLGCRGAPGRWRGVARPHVTFQSSSPTHDHCPSEALPSLPAAWLPWPLPSGHSPFSSYTLCTHLLTSLLSDFPLECQPCECKDRNFFFRGMVYFVY